MSKIVSDHMSCVKATSDHLWRRIQAFVSKPHSTFLNFLKLLQNFSIKCCYKWLSVVDIYCSNQIQKENAKNFAFFCKKWRPQGEKMLEKWGFFFVSKPHTSPFEHLKAMKIHETFWGGRPFQNPACWPKKLIKSPWIKALELWPWFWPLLPFLRLRGRKLKK